MTQHSPQQELLAPLTISAHQAPSVVEQLKELGSLYEVSPVAENFALTVASGGIPEELPEELEEGQPIVSTFLHSLLQGAGYYGRFTKNFARQLSELVGPEAIVLDPFAGAGYAVKALRAAGVATRGTDDGSWIAHESFERLDALEAIAKYGAESTHLLMSWTPPEDTIDAQVVELLRSEHPHMALLFIGEGRNGCTGSNAFWDVVGYEERSGVDYRTTWGLRDSFYYFPEP